MDVASAIAAVGGAYSFEGRVVFAEIGLEFVDIVFAHALCDLLLATDE